MIVTSGAIINVHLNALGDLRKISFDKYLVGKLAEYITDVAFTSKLILITYLESRVTYVNFATPLNFDDENYESVSQGDPRVQMLDLLGPPGRRLHRRISLSSDSSTCLFWWSTSGQEVYPWAPNLNEEDRANLIMYSFRAKKSTGLMEPKRLGYARSHNDPILTRLISDRTVLIVGQDASRHGEIQVDSALFTFYDGEPQLRRSRANRLSLSSSIKCSVSINDYLLVVSTTDGTLILIDISQNKFQCQTKAAFIPTQLAIHPENAIILSANEKGLLQSWDAALNPICLSFPTDESCGGVSNVLDMAQSIHRVPIGLCDVKWCEQSKFQPSPVAFNLLTIRFHGGPIALLRFSGGVLSSSGSLGPIQIINQHLQSNNYQAALLFMNQMDWPTQGETILIGINKTFHKLFRQAELTKDNESWMEMCLGLFYAPSRPMPEETIDEFSEQVHDLARKFFHRLLRHGQVAKAFKLAVDINDYDLFMDIYHYAMKKRNEDLANAALIKAQTVFAKGELLSNEDESSEGEGNALLVSSLPRPVKGASSERLPGPMQLFSSTINASATPALAILEPQPSSVESSMTMQPQLSAIYLKTTAAKRISTNDYQVR